MFFSKKYDDSKWEELNREVIGLTRAQDTVRALSRCKELLKISNKHYGSKHRNTMVTLGNMGMIYLLRRELDQSESHFLQALEICEKLFGKFSKEYSAITTNLSQVFKAKAQEADSAVAAVGSYGEKHKAAV